MSRAMVPLEGVLESRARLPYRCGRPLLPPPRAERVGPHVGSSLTGETLHPQPNGFFEKLSLGDAELSRRPVHVVQGALIETGGENFLHT